MKRRFMILLFVIVTLAEREFQKTQKRVGELFLRIGRRLVLGWTDSDGWTHAFFLRCHLVDIEVYFSDGLIARGPLYALYPSVFKKRTLIAKLNWCAHRHHFRTWEFGGACDLLLGGYRKLYLLPCGDAWFSFDGGHAVIYCGEPKERLSSGANNDIKKVYEYF